MSSKHIVFYNVQAPGHVMPTRAICAEFIKRGYKITYQIRFRNDTEKTIEITKKLIEDIGCDFVQYSGVSSFQPQPNEVGPGAVLPLMQGSIEDNLKWINSLQPFPSLIVYDPFAAYGHLAAQILNIKSICSMSFFGVDSLGKEVNSQIAIRNSLEEKFQVNLREPSRYFNFAFSNSLHILYTITEMVEGFINKEEQKNYIFAGAMISKRRDELSCQNQSVINTLNEKKKLGKKIVFISFGTIVNIIGKMKGFLTDLYKQLLKVVSGFEDIHVVFSLGPNLEILKNEVLPPNCEIFSYVPQLEVLALTDVFITHGGNNSTHEALYYGIPLLVIPFFADQPVIAKVVSEKKIGISFFHDEEFSKLEEIWPPPERKSINFESLKKAIHLLLTEKEYKNNSTIISKIMQNIKLEDIVDKMIEYSETNSKL